MNKPRKQNSFIDILMIPLLVLMIGMGGIYVYVGLYGPEGSGHERTADTAEAEADNQPQSATTYHPSRYRLSDSSLVVEVGPAPSVLDGLRNWQLFGVLADQSPLAEQALTTLMSNAGSFQSSLRRGSTVRLEHSDRSSLLVLPVRPAQKTKAVLRGFNKIFAPNRSIEDTDDEGADIRLSCEVNTRCRDLYARHHHNNIVISTRPGTLRSATGRASDTANKSLFDGPPDQWTVRAEITPERLSMLSDEAQSVSIMAQLEDGSLNIRGHTGLRELLDTNKPTDPSTLQAPQLLPAQTVAYTGFELPASLKNQGVFGGLLHYSGITGEIGAGLHIDSTILFAVLSGQAPMDQLEEAVGLTIVAEHRDHRTVRERLQQLAELHERAEFRFDPDRLVFAGDPRSPLDDITLYVRMRESRVVLTTEKTRPETALAETEAFKQAISDYPETLNGLAFLNTSPIGKAFPDQWPPGGSLSESGAGRLLRLIDPGPVRAILTKLDADIMALRVSDDRTLQLRSSLHGPLFATGAVAYLARPLIDDTALLESQSTERSRTPDSNPLLNPPR